MKNVNPFSCGSPLLVILIALATCGTAAGQAALGLRHMSYTAPVHGISELAVPANRYEFGLHYRWFDATEPYAGSLLQQSVIDRDLTEIVNSHNLNISVGFQLNARWGFYATLPLVWNQKSSVYEHSLVNGTYINRQRKLTEALGVGDLLVGLHFSALDRTKPQNGNLVVGAAVKIPTGDPGVRDVWHDVGPSRSDVVRPVDPVIQPGDGSWGFLLETKGSLLLFEWLGIYGEARYLASPADTNGVATFRNTFGELFAFEGSTSVADQYMLRSGISLRVPGSPVILSSGFRMDGVPVNDIFGASNGFRRPGYANSWENTLQLEAPGFSVYVSIPYIFFQNRDASNADRRYTAVTGLPHNGGASFARLMVFAGVKSRF